jgi:hypothetical protein
MAAERLLSLTPDDDTRELGELTVARQGGDPARMLARATTWRVEALLETYGFDLAAPEARQRVEALLAGDGFETDPPLGRALPRSDVWVYPVANHAERAAEAPVSALREDDAARSPTLAQGHHGLGRWQRLLILGGCAAMVVALFAFLLTTRGHLTALRPGGGGSRATSEATLTDSFRRGYEHMLAHKGGTPMQLKELYCAAGAGSAIRCEALTHVSGSGDYPAQFDVSLVNGKCWQARPLEPNIVNASLRGCA